MPGGAASLANTVMEDSAIENAIPLGMAVRSVYHGLRTKELPIKDAAYEANASEHAGK